MNRYDLLTESCMAAYHRGCTTPEMLWRLCAYMAWTTTDQCMIRDINSEIIPLRLNRIQRTILGAMMYQAALGEPVRIVVLKARKGGTTTFVETLLFFLCAHFGNQHAYMIAHQAESTEDIFQIGKFVGKNYKARARAVLRSLYFPDNSRFHCHTAGGEGVGGGMTVNLLHLSEVALWKTNKEETEYTVTEAVGRVVNSIIVQESTARGREMFYDKYEAAQDEGHPYVSIFIPWFLDERLTIDGTFHVEQDQDERLLMRIAQGEYDIELTAGQLAWRREKIADKGLSVFRQEYPSTSEEAIQGARGLVLPGMRQCVVDALPFDYGSVGDPQARVGGVDHGYNDPTVVLTAVHVDQVLYVVDLYRASAGLAEDHIAGIHPGHTYYCDPAGLAAREEMAAVLRRVDGQDVQLVPAPRRKADRQLEFINAEWEMVRKRIVTGRLRILGEHAAQLLVEADNLFWNERTGMPQMTRGETWGHFDCLDALRYACMGVEQDDRPIEIMPRTVQMSRRRSMRAV